MSNRRKALEVAERKRREGTALGAPFWRDVGAESDPDFEIAAQIPCVDCGDPVRVTRFAVDMAKTLNRCARARGLETLKGAELACCRKCYDVRQQVMADRALECADRDLDLWAGFRERYERGRLAERPGIEREFLKAVDDKPLYSVLAKRFIERVEHRESKGRGRRRTNDDAL